MGFNPVRQIRASLAAVALVLAVLTSPATAQPLSTPEQVLRYLESHRQDISLVSYTVAPSGMPDPADPVIRVNAFRPMPLASTIKIVILAAYAREVVAGRLDPNEAIPLGEWDRFYFPIVDEGVHATALHELGFETDELGFATNPSATVPLDRIVAAMIEHSDNAGPDLLLERIGDEAVRATLAEARLAAQDQPLPTAGLFLTAANHAIGPLTQPRLRQLIRLPRGQFEERVREVQALYVEDDAWKTDEITWWLTEAPQPAPRLVSRAANRLFPKGSANDYARIMAGVVTGTFLSPEVSAIMRSHLEWPLQDPALAEIFASMGTKGGSIEGVLTEASWYVPREGDFAGRPRVTVLFFRDMPLWAWNGLQESYAQQLFQALLAVDRTLAEEVRERLGA